MQKALNRFPAGGRTIRTVARVMAYREVTLVGSGRCFAALGPEPLAGALSRTSRIT